MGLLWFEIDCRWVLLGCLMFARPCGYLGVYVVHVLREFDVFGLLEMCYMTVRWVNG